MRFLPRTKLKSHVAVRLCLALRGHLVSGDWMALCPCKDSRPHFTPVSAQIPATETLVTASLQPDCLTAKSLSVPSLCLCVLMVCTYTTVTQLHKGRTL